MYRVAQIRLGIVSTYVPRRCGLATYTADLREALRGAAEDRNEVIDPVVVAIDRDGLSYGDEVITVVSQDRISSYEAAADDLAAAGVDAVLIQHEYGIFGGPDGSHVLHFARALTRRAIPYLVTLHTQLSQPSPGQAATLAALCAGAARVTVFTETARRMAVRAGVAAGHQLTVVPHGAPEILRAPAESTGRSARLRELLEGFGDDTVLTTFGLVSAGKGLEDAIEALARVVPHHPRARYVIAGATHPEIVRHEGESYRQSLHRKVRQLGLAGNVHFVDAFLTPAELAELLRRTTIFVTPYRSPEQICSGALTFAVAAGCPVVSTAYRYAEDLLSDGAGVLTPCHDVAALAEGINRLLGDPGALAAAKRAADIRGAGLTWPAVALQAADLIRDVVLEARAGGTGRLAVPPVPVPRLRLHHLARLTDEFGIVEFCTGSHPDHSYGYNVDDVARLAVVSAGLLSLAPPAPPHVTNLAQRWVRMSVRFLAAAGRGDHGRLHNRMSYGGSWTDEPHPGDHVGRAIWALGVLDAASTVPADVRGAARELFDALAPHAPALAACGLRSAAYAVLGLVAAGRGPLPDLVRRLDAELVATAEGDWYWFEPELTYDNARLAQALLAGGSALGDRMIADRALAALDWYADHAGLTAGTLRNVGNRWHHRDAPEGWADDGDEQPIDTASAVEAMVDAWRYTGDARYGSLAGVAYGWFHGRNRRGVAMYDPRTGACHDGLTPAGVNPNRGAESTLAHLQAQLALLLSGLAGAASGRSGAEPAVKRLRLEISRAALPDRVPVEPPARARAAVAKPATKPAAKAERKGTVRASDRPSHRTGTRTTKGHHDAR
jgi:glycosyltransferase involved in cell wall biosynthesis